MRSAHQAAHSIQWLFAIVLMSLIGCSNNPPPTTPTTPTNGTPTTPGAGNGPIKVLVGANLELSGDVGTWGQMSKRGMEIAAEEINADPKSGVQFKVIYEDNASKADDSKKAVKKLILQDQVNVIIGAVASGDTLATIDIAKDEKIPLITHASTNVTITKLGGEYVSRICFHDDFQGQCMARFGLNELKAKTAVVIVAKGDPYSEGLVASFKKEFTSKGGTIVEEQAYQKGDQDFRTLSAKLKAANPDVVWLPGYFNEVALIIKQARGEGFLKTFLGADGWDSPKLYQLGGATLKDNYFCNHYSASDPNPMVQAFVKKFEERHKEKPDAMAALAYDALYCVADAARRAGSADPEKLKNAINTIKDIKTLCGTVTMGPDREVIKDAVVLKTGETDHIFYKNFK